MRTKDWHVDITVVEDEAEGNTRAEATLRTSAGAELKHVGLARRNPADQDVPEIGDELAVCRALAGLAHDLLEATANDVEANDPSGGPAVIAMTDDKPEGWDQG